jgi:hypothetical protein
VFEGGVNKERIPFPPTYPAILPAVADGSSPVHAINVLPALHFANSARSCGHSADRAVKAMLPRQKNGGGNMKMGRFAQEWREGRLYFLPRIFPPFSSRRASVDIVN